MDKQIRLFIMATVLTSKERAAGHFINISRTCEQLYTFQTMPSSDGFTGSRYLAAGAIVFCSGQEW